MFADEANHIYIAMPMCNLIEYSDNYSDTSTSLWLLKRDEAPVNNWDEIPIDGTNSSVKYAKIVVPLNSWRSLEMPLINRKVYLELNWIENCTLPYDGDTAKFAITDAKLHVPIVTFSTKDSENLEKQLNKGFKRYAYWNSYERKPEKVVKKKKKPVRTT